MTTPSESPGLKAIRYAEDSLKVNAIYEEAVEKRNELDALFTDLSTARDMRRALEAHRVDREMEVQADEVSKHPAMSAAAMKEHLKVALHQDASLLTLREQLRDMSDKIDGMEFDREMLSTDIKIAVARLQELGGYLQYLAAIKQAAQAKEASRTDGDPWK